MNTQFPRMHVSLYVSDINKSTTFYSTFFGLKPVKVKPGYAKFILEKPSLIISFVENKTKVQSNFGHLGFQVERPEELDEKMRYAEGNGLVMKKEMGTNCCYAKQDKFWVNDPDGVQWEVYYFHSDSEFNDPHYEMAEAGACCTVSSESSKSSCGCNANVSAGEMETACC